MPVAVVTGSSSGIGRETALRLADSGYSVVLHARSSLRGLQQTARQILAQKGGTNQQGQGGVKCVTADIRSGPACRSLVEAAFAWQQRIDVWVNNAGADVLTAGAKQLPFEQRFQALTETDVLGTIRLSRLVARYMRPIEARLPSIINIGWDQADLGMEGEPGQLFCTTKAAVSAFTRAFALTVAPDIRVNCVAPGWIRTNWGVSEASGYWDERARSEALLNRWGTPEDVAAAIVWLASPEAQFVNGECLRVNGGRRFIPPPPPKRPYPSR